MLRAVTDRSARRLTFCSYSISSLFTSEPCTRKFQFARNLSIISSNSNHLAILLGNETSRRTMETLKIARMKWFESINFFVHGNTARHIPASGRIGELFHFTRFRDNFLIHTLNLFQKLHQHCRRCCEVPPNEMDRMLSRVVPPNCNCVHTCCCRHTAKSSTRWSSPQHSLWLRAQLSFKQFQTPEGFDRHFLCVWLVSRIPSEFFHVGSEWSSVSTEIVRAMTHHHSNFRIFV